MLYLITSVKLFLSSISSGWLFWSVNHTSMSWNSELNYFKKVWLVGEISNKLPNGLFGTKVYKTLESCWSSLLTILQWTNTTSVISRCGTFSPFLSLFILFSLLPSNFTFSGAKSSRLYPSLILNVILFSIFLHISVLMIYQYFFHAFLKYIQNINDTWSKIFGNLILEMKVVAQSSLILKQYLQLTTIKNVF